jgi:hypothetical protein
VPLLKENMSSETIQYWGYMANILLLFVLGFLKC